MSRLSFSQRIKKELSTLEHQNRACQIAQFGLAFFLCGRIEKDSLVFEFLQKEYLNYYLGILRAVFGQDAAISVDKVHHLVEIKRCHLLEDVQQLLDPYFASDDNHKRVEIIKQDEPSWLPCMLRMGFMLCGSVNEPIHSYHLAFVLRNQRNADLIKDLLNHFSITCKYLLRDKQHICYIKDGQQISEFLLQSGAHRALLEFESLRVEKEMRNTVNRVVNCDNANTQRIANTGVRQLTYIQIINQHIGIGALSPELAETARLRLANPELSLKELGDLLSPPLGKSGMNHRLKKIEQIGQAIIDKRHKAIEEKTGENDGH